MNWTGGGLRRHSGWRRDPLTRNSRANFAKSRRGHPKPVEQVTAPTPAARQDAHGRQHLQETDSFGKHAHTAPLDMQDAWPEKRAAEAPRCLLDMKKQLLQQHDWAAVSAARPLRMDITPTEHLANFGRRRKLTASDRERMLSSGTRRGLLGRDQRGWISPLADIDQLEIRVNGLPVNRKPRGDFNGVVSSQHSSQTLLLQSEEAGAYEGHSPLRMERRASYRSSSPSMLELDNDARVAELPADVRPSSVTRKVTDQMKIPQGSQSFFDSDMHEQINTRCHIDCSDVCRDTAATPLPRRFTLDDQIRAEREGWLFGRSTSHTSETGRNRNVLLEQSRLHRVTASPSPRHVFPGSIVPLQSPKNSQSPWSNQCSGWLPEQKCLISRPTDQQDSDDVRVWNVPNNSFSDTRSNLPSVGAEGRQRSPVKVYGQCLPLDEEDLLQAQQKAGASPISHMNGIRRSLSPVHSTPRIQSPLWTRNNNESSPVITEPVEKTELDIEVEEGDMRHSISPVGQLSSSHFDLDHMNPNPTRFLPRGTPVTELGNSDHLLTAERGGHFNHQLSSTPSSSSLAHALTQHQQRRFAAAL